MKRKVAVSVPAELVEAAEAAVAAGQAPSVSAYFSDALREKAQRDSLVLRSSNHLRGLQYMKGGLHRYWLRLAFC